MRRLVVGAALIGVLQLSSVGTVEAQDRDLRPLLDRLDRMERDMNQLQRQVYRGGSTSGAPVPLAPADGGTAVNLELRLDQLETQMRTLTGSLEEVNYSIDQLKRRLDKLVGDVDQRLTQLEHPGTPAGAAARRAAAGGTPPPPPPPAPPPRGPAQPAAPPDPPPPP